MGSQNKILVVVSLFNELVSKSLETACIEVLKEKGAAWKVVYVPGAFEAPVVATKAARSKNYPAVIALGCVIRGETPHFDIVAGESARGLMQVSVETGIPIINGILTTDTIEQALSRSGLKHGNKGRDAAHAALQMIQVLGEI